MDNKLLVYATLFLLGIGLVILVGISPMMVRTNLPKTVNAPLTIDQQAPLDNLGTAADFAGIANWLNVEKPLSLAELKGQVIVIDFWTYSCINCIRTLPHVKNWYQKYKDQGLVVVGVHTPEFEFEKKLDNVRMAIDKYQITYPVAVDNDYQTWRAYNNRYWPAKYFIDANGVIRYTHFGEGRYEESEQVIRQLLQESGSSLDKDGVSPMPDLTPRSSITPETYLGAGRMERFVSREQLVVGEVVDYTSPSLLAAHQLAFDGPWKVTEEYAEALKGAKLRFRFHAKHVYLVMTSVDGQKKQVDVKIEGRPSLEELAGEDADDNGSIAVDQDRLYHLVRLPEVDGQELTLSFPQGQVKLFAFTFGDQ